MPIDLEVSQERRRVTLTMSGVVSLADAIDTIEEAIRHPSYGPGYDILSDHTAVDVPLTPDATKRMLSRLEQLAHLIKGTRWAAVATSPAPYGMLRMLSVHIQPLLTLQVFATTEEAERWLAEPREVAS
jgi:hypothetical protein